ncbi:hypothetical protein IAT38_005021 [Cryptococcus sp. DSM 104549]
MPAQTQRDGSAAGGSKGATPAPEGGIRRTQRAPKRCKQCALRRIKCDGTIPCVSCVSRAQAHLCQRETVLVKGRLVGGAVDTPTASGSELATSGLGNGAGVNGGEESTSNVGSQSPAAVLSLEGLSKEDLLGQVRSLLVENRALRNRLQEAALVKAKAKQGVEESDDGGKKRKRVEGKEGERERESPRSPGSVYARGKSLVVTPTEEGLGASPLDQVRTEARNDELAAMARNLGFLHDSQSGGYDDPNQDCIDEQMTFPTGQLLPPYALAHRLLTFAFTSLGYLICPVPYSFLGQVTTLYLSLPSTSFHHSASPPPSIFSQPQPNSHPQIPIAALIETRPAWSALFLSMLSAALVYVPEGTAEDWGVPRAQKYLLARLWFRAAVNTMLNGAMCLAKPRLIHLQTFCAMTLVFQPFDCMALHDTMLASMVQAARQLGLHHLRDLPDERSPAAETGRRIWTFLIAREIHYTGDHYMPAISPTEPKPYATCLNIDEVDGPAPLVSLPLSHPTRVSYLLAGSRVTAFTQSIKDLPWDTPYGDILKLDEELIHIHDDMDWLREGAEGLENYPPWVATARHVMALKISQRRLFLHRHYFSLTATHLPYAPSRRLSLSAASDICRERRMHDLPFDDKLDTINGVLPAAIVLLLDAIFPLPGDRTTYGFVLERCHQVEELVGPLRAATYSRMKGRMGQTLMKVDELLGNTLRAAQAAEMVRAAWMQPSREVEQDTSFSAVLDGLSFEALLDSWDLEWSHQ